MYELTGTIKRLFDTQTFPSGFTKREFVVTTEDRYPQDIKLSTVKDRIGILDGVREGDRVTVGFYLRGNEYKERFYVDLDAHVIRAAAVPEAEDGPPPDEPPPGFLEEGGDIPF